MHELSSWRDCVLVEFEAAFLLSLSEGNLILPLGLDVSLALSLLFHVFSSSKATRPLLVQFCTWCNTINRQVQDFLGSDNVHDLVGVVIDVLKDLVLALRRCSTILWG